MNWSFLAYGILSSGCVLAGKIAESMPGGELGSTAFNLSAIGLLCWMVKTARSDNAKREAQVAAVLKRKDDTIDENQKAITTLHMKTLDALNTLSKVLANKRCVADDPDVKAIGHSKQVT